MLVRELHLAFFVTLKISESSTKLILCLNCLLVAAPLTGPSAFQESYQNSRNDCEDDDGELCQAENSLACAERDGRFGNVDGKANFWQLLLQVSPINIRMDDSSYGVSFWTCVSAFHWAFQSYHQAIAGKLRLPANRFAWLVDFVLEILSVL